MPTDLEKLVVQLSADVRGFQNDLAKANGIANKQARAIENRFRAMNKNLDGIGRSAARSLVAPLGAVAATLSTREVLAYADAWTSAKNSLAVAGVTGRKQKVVLDQLFASAQRNATPLGALTQLYGRAAQVAGDLGAQQSDLIAFSDGVATALKVAGTSATEASGALLQLGQLLGSGTVHAEEFNSVQEGARPILIAVANGLDAAGGSVSRLKQLVVDGKVSSQQFFQAFLRGLPTIQSMAANSTQTIEQGVVKVTNAFTKYIGQTDDSLGASRRLVIGLNALADNFDETADLALKLASIIAAALVGRALSGMIAKLALTTAATFRLIAALRAATSASQLIGALGSMSAVAGPLGTIIGTVVVTALGLYAESAIEASARSERVTADLERMGLAGKKAAEGIDAVTEAHNKLPGAEKISENLQGIDDYTKEIAALQAQIASILEPLLTAQNAMGEANLDPATKQILTLVDAYGKGTATFQQFMDGLDAAARANPDFSDLISSLKELEERLKNSVGRLYDLKKAQEDVANPAIKPPNRRATVGTDYQTLFGKQKALVDASKEAGLSTSEKRLADEIERLRKAIQQERPGTVVSDAELRPQALRNLAAGDLTRTIDSYVNDTLKAEGKGKNPNSSAEGFGQFIESTWLDLFKRYFPDRAKGMSNAAILALRRDEATSRTLIEAYARENAAVLQKAGVSVDEAALQLSHFLGAGDAAKVLSAAPGTPLKGLISDKAIKANPTILGGGRTVDDAIAYAQSRVGQSTPGAQRLISNEDFDAYLSREKQNLELLQQEGALRQQLGPETERNVAAYAEFQRASELLAEAQQANAAAALEVHSVNELLHGDLSKLTPAAREQVEAMRALAAQYGQTKAAGAALEGGQQAVKAQVDSVNEIGRDALGTLISDLREGKSGAEALADALGRVADRLIDMALNAVFSSGPTGAGGLGGLVAGLLGIGGKKDGGAVHAAGGGAIRGPGTSRSDSIPAMLSDGEFVVNAAAASRYPALLQAINSGRVPMKLADGGFASRPSIALAGHTAGITLAPSYQIDARGSQMSETQFRAILKENNRHVLKQVASDVIPRYDANRWRRG